MQMLGRDVSEELKHKLLVLLRTVMYTKAEWMHSPCCGWDFMMGDVMGDHGDAGR